MTKFPESTKINGVMINKPQVDITHPEPRAGLISRVTALVVLLAPVLLLASFLFHQIFNNDIWWHLKTGELILTGHGITGTDPYSLANQGKDWINFEWLSQVVLYLVHSASGPEGLVVFSALILAAAYFLAGQGGYSKRYPIISAGILLLAVLASSERYLVRPEIFTMLFAGLYFCILHCYRNHSGRMIYLLPIAQVLWENMHGGTLLGIGIVGAYVVGQGLLLWKRAPENWRRGPLDTEPMSWSAYKPLLLVLGLVILASMLNPWGLKTLYLIIMHQGHAFTMANIAW